jgi:hypothetical protein
MLSTLIMRPGRRPAFERKGSASVPLLPPSPTFTMSINNRVTVCEQRLATKRDHPTGRPGAQPLDDR